MGNPNWENRTLFHGDNLEFMRKMNSESVDLIASDPPFNKGKDFHATPDSLAKGARFQDRWSWEDDVHEEWLDQLTDDHPDLMSVIQNSRKTYGDDMGAFLCFIGVRLIEMRRLLKPRGSIYLHCDPTASHYLKMVMDAIFGRKNFRNEIVWFYHDTPGRPTKDFARKHDVILRYVKNHQQFTFNADSVRIPILEASIERYLTPRNLGGRSYVGGEASTKGKIPEDVWSFPAVKGNSKEAYGYPTQKPLALYERIINASSNGGDVVLDPFCGCATTLVACERLRPKRKWVGIDIWEKSSDAVVDRLESEDLIAPKYTRKTPEMKERHLWAKEFHFTSKLPKRTDDKETDVVKLELIESFKKEPWERLSRKKMVEHLAEAQEDEDGWIVCAGCGRQLELEFTELDHISPRAEGGSNDITNRILLCGPCNKKKKHKLTLVGLRQLNSSKKDGWMHNKIAAKNVQTKAKNRVEKIRRGFIPLEYGLLHPE